jgi:hypothetical protein
VVSGRVGPHVEAKVDGKAEPRASLSGSPTGVLAETAGVAGD